MAKKYKIRPAEPPDADGLLEVRRDAIMALADEYGRAEAERWAGAAHVDRERAFGAITANSVWVSESGSKLVGWVEVSSSTVKSLYVRASASRLGVGSSLIACAEREIQNGGGSLAYLEASPNAEAFYACRFSISVRAEIIELFLSALDRSTTDGRPNPDKDSVSQ